MATMSATTNGARERPEDRSGCAGERGGMHPRPDFSENLAQCPFLVGVKRFPLCLSRELLARSAQCGGCHSGTVGEPSMFDNNLLLCLGVGVSVHFSPGSPTVTLLFLWG